MIAIAPHTSVVSFAGPCIEIGRGGEGVLVYLPLTEIRIKNRAAAPRTIGKGVYQ
jgi:hypothetical protein